MIIGVNAENVSSVSFVWQMYQRSRNARSVVRRLAGALLSLTSESAAVILTTAHE
jgi:hypothetical protein